MKILLVSSSSGGHIYPCINLGKKLKNRGHDITFLGIKNQIEEEIFFGKTILVNIPNSFKKSIKSFNLLLNEASKIKKEISQFDVCIVFGGFISFFVVYFCKPRKIYIHEQNVILGDANKLCYPFCEKLFFSFPNTIKYRKSIYSSNPSCYRFYLKKFSSSKIKKILFIFGSIGSTSMINKVVEFDSKINGVEMTVVKGKVKEIPICKNIKFVENIDSFLEFYNYDLVVTRGGASTILELTKARIPFIIVPSPYVKHNHQMKNANYMKKIGCCYVIEEKNFDFENFSNVLYEMNDITKRYTLYRNLEKFDFGFDDVIEKEIEKND